MQTTTRLFLLTILLFGLSAPAVLAMHPEGNRTTENIRERIVAVVPEPAEAVSPFSLELFGVRFTLSGLLEVEAFYQHPEGGGEHEELNLSTAQLGLEAMVNEYLAGHVVALWEEGATEPAEFDEVVLSLRSPWAPLGLSPTLDFGRLYVPFGAYRSAMVSDPLTLELGETRQTSGVVGVEGDRWSFCLGGFDGDVDPRADDRGLDSWVAAFELSPREGLLLGASWISDLAESGAELVQTEGLHRHSVPGASAFLSWRPGDIGLEFEYLSATEDFASALVAEGEDLTGRRPSAWFAELSWAVNERLELASRYEQARDYQADVRRFGATASYGLCDYALVAVEYLHADAKGADGDSTHTLTAQLAVEF